MSSVTMDEDTTDGQAADTEDEIQRQTNKIRKEMEKERKQKVKAKQSASSLRTHTHPDVQIIASNAGSESSNGCGMSPTMAAIAAANHSYHQALYTPSLSSCASASTPNLANSALYEPYETLDQQHHQMATLNPEQYYQQMAATLHNAQHVSRKVGTKVKF